LADDVQRGGIPGQPGAKASFESLKRSSSPPQQCARFAASSSRSSGVSREIHAFVTVL
jgi:hypothetical protein